MWEVEFTDEFEEWYSTLSEEEQDSVVARVELLETAGPGLGRPVVDNVHQSRHATMKERWYVHFVPVADDLHDAHLEELREEGLL